MVCGESSVNDLMRCEILKGYLYTRGCPNPDDAIFFYRERVDESFEALSLVLMILVFICTGIMNRFGGDNEEGGVIV